MRFQIKLIVLSVLALGFILGSGGSNAQTIQQAMSDIVLKNGETMEFSDIWWISNDCRSLLISTPEVEIMEGPPGVSAVIKPAKIVPRTFGCANAIPGGKLIITATDIEEYSRSNLVLRVTYKSRNGVRQRSKHIRVTLYP